jgi:thymidylate synthase (FAD)
MKTEYIHHAGSDLTVVNAARVSFDKESEFEFQGYDVEKTIDNVTLGFLPIYSLNEKDEKLITYLAKHKHFSPFNHAFITMRVTAPMFVARQLVKHKFMPWNEVSRRYVDTEPTLFIPNGWREKAENKKQGSADTFVTEIDNMAVNTHVKMLYEQSISLYRKMLQANICPEQARMVLPQSMYTSWYWSGTLGAYVDMLRLRLDPHTQLETRIIAEQAYNIVKEHFPVSVKALLNNAN